MADNFNSGGRDFIGESDVHYQFRVAFVVCELCGDNGARAEAKKVLLWEEKVGICGGGGNYYGGGYDDDIADNIILLWYSVVNFGGGKFADFADFAICDGVSVSLWCMAGAPGVETVVGWLATKLLDFHIAVVEFFGGMKSFLVEIEPYQVWVFLIYLLIFVPLAIGLIRRKMVKLREENY